MLSSLIVLGALLGPVGRVQTQNPQFPKPNFEPPVALIDSSIFKYLSPEDKQRQWKPLEVGRDWSSLEVPAIKPDAIKIRVLLAVSERDFSNPEYSNTLETRDKTRLLEAMIRLKSLLAIVSDGTINFEFVPRFVPEPIYDIRDFKQLINAEFNKSKFESDDSIERGPFASVIAISSSHVNVSAEPGEDYIVHGFSDLGGSGQDMWFEEGLFYVAQAGIFNRIANHFDGFRAGFSTQESRTLLMDRLTLMRGEYQRLFDPGFRKDADLITKWSQLSLREPGRPFRASEMATIQSPAAIEVKDGALNYSELSIMRAGEFALPPSDKWGTQKALKFDIRTRIGNPIAVKFWKKDGTKYEVVLGGEAANIPLNTDFNWQNVIIGIPGTDVMGATIGAPTRYFGRTRMRSELTQFEFQNFDLVSESQIPPLAIGAFPSIDTEAAIRESLTTGNKATKRRALANVDLIKTLKGLEPALLAACGDLDAGVAHDATRAYFELLISGPPTPAQLTSMSTFLTGPPNEAAREVALAYVAKYPAFASFTTVTGNTMRDSWRVRRSAAVALGALVRADVKEKEACHQTLLLMTGQDMALLRLTAIGQLDPSQKLDSQRLEFLMVNDPCESVRLACLRVLSAKMSIPKEKLLGSLADESPTLRERIPAALGANSSILREALQKMVVDQDAYVRLSALQNLAVLGSVKEGEIQNLFADKHPAIQIALLHGAAKGAWKIPADALARLKESPIPAVRQLAMEIK